MPIEPGVEIVTIGVTSPAGNSPEAVLAAADQAPKPAPLSFPGREALVGASGFSCDLSQTRELLDPMKTRRWGRIQTMSLLAAKKASLPGALKGNEAQTGVYVGTGLGSLGETAVFLENMVRQKENFPKPAHFVNSVHNSTASTLGLEFGLKGENITVAHREISFDAALGHAFSALGQGRVKAAVVCGADEMNYFHVLTGLSKGLWKKGEEPLKPLAPGNSPGTLPGEGAAVCVLAADGNAGGESYGRLLGVKCGRYQRDAHTYIHLPKAGDFLEELLSRAGVKASEVDLLLLGANGDSRLDAVYLGVGAELGRRAGKDIPPAAFKQLCGDYRAASGFGFALAALILRSGRVPAGLFGKTTGTPGGPFKTILLYNLSRSGVHSACLLRSL
ncbi:MAG TPA: beta-ketoacyl synthase N-terminal-like domain-containing protein [bacterium]|jgi:3-oxoacyl-(acyl-carrier-protein) synthase|nr:beta-ketoacyl synthase N-terminal-like domain-containing protein [bacterium]